MAFPSLILALIVLSVLGTSIPVLVVVMAVLASTVVFRLSRAVAADINAMEYVEIARLRGEGMGWFLFREILPNAAPTLIAEFGLRFVNAGDLHLLTVVPRTRHPATLRRPRRDGAGQRAGHHLRTRRAAAAPQSRSRFSPSR